MQKDDMENQYNRQIDYNNGSIHNVSQQVPKPLSDNTASSKGDSSEYDSLALAAHDALLRKGININSPASNNEHGYFGYIPPASMVPASTICARATAMNVPVFASGATLTETRPDTEDASETADTDKIKYALRQFKENLRTGLKITFTMIIGGLLLLGFPLSSSKIMQTSEPLSLSSPDAVKIEDEPVLMDKSLELTSDEYAMAKDIYNKALEGQTSFILDNMDYIDAAGIIDAVGLRDLSATYTCFQHFFSPYVYWTIQPEKSEFFIQKPRKTKEAIEKAGIRDGMDPTEAVRLISGYLVDTVVYDDTLKRHSAVEAFDGLAVCSGYAEAFRLMCTACGIPCQNVYGYAGEDRTKHAWNKVYLENEWRYIDVTWMDTGTAFKDMKYYLTEELWENHELSDDIREFL